MSEKLIEVIKEPDYAEDTLPIICKHCGRVTRIRILTISEVIKDLNKLNGETWDEATYFTSESIMKMIKKWEEKLK